MQNIAEMMEEVRRITDQLIDFCQPLKIILFGSVAAGIVHKNSDIDLCVIAEYSDKQKLLQDIYMHIESESPFDVVVYSPADWEKNVNDTASFAHLIHTKGTIVYG